MLYQNGDTLNYKYFSSQIYATYGHGVMLLFVQEPAPILLINFKFPESQVSPSTKKLRLVYHAVQVK